MPAQYLILEQQITVRGRCIGVKWSKLMPVLEAYGGHLPELVKKKKEEKKFITGLVIVLEVISPEMQVLDVFLNRSFREHTKIQIQ